MSLPRSLMCIVNAPRSNECLDCIGLAELCEARLVRRTAMLFPGFFLIRNKPVGEHWR